MSVNRITDLDNIIATTGNTLRDAMCMLETSGTGIVLVCNKQQCLVDTVTDGDVRRAILTNTNFDTPLWRLYGEKARDGKEPITALADESNGSLHNRMTNARVRHLPLVDAEHHIVGLAVLDRASSQDACENVQAVVMAGGFGTRLRPLTDNTPKPMLPIGERPLLERTVVQLRDCGIRDVRLTTHYLPDQIVDHFGNGSRFGVDIEYVAEDRPLGTAGSLKLLPSSDKPLIIINGDILTSVDFGELIKYHRENRADMTVGVRQYEINVPREVIESSEGLATKVDASPRYNFLVNAGIYVIEPQVHQYIPDDRRFDMTELIECTIDNGGHVASFPVIEYWLDIGHHEDFIRAQRDIQQMKWAG